MKRVILSLSAVFALVVIIAVFSCEKAIISNENESGDANGNLKVTVFEIEKTPFASLTRTVENASAVVTRLNFAVYDTDGARLKQINQELGKNADFGTASFQLEEGTYQLVVVGHSSKSNPTMTNPAKIQFSNPSSSGGTGFTDTFYYYGTMVVGSSTAQVNISMKRATAMFRLKTADTKPTAVKRFQFYYEGGSGTLDATTGYGCVASKQSVFVDATESGCQQFEMYTFPHQEEDEVTFTVKALGANDNILYMKEFANVKMQRNCITQYTGNFFTGDDVDVTPVDEPDEPDSSEPSSIVVKVDPEWGKTFDFTF